MKRSLTALLCLPLLALAGCASGPSEPATTPESAAPAAFPVTVTSAGEPLTIERAPERIVSMSPTATETLFAIGAGPQVVAADDNSNYPPEAPKTKLSAFTPNAEAVAGYDPDLVVISNDANGLVKALTKLDVPVLQQPAPATLDEAYAQMLTLGDVTGHRDDADKLVTTTRQKIAAAVAAVPASQAPRRVYHELDPSYYSATSNTFIGSVYRQFGLQNIADTAKDAAGGYPKLSAEFVVTAEPDLIVLADTKCCDQSLQSLRSRPALSAVPAVAQRRVVVADDDIASRWGPRVADFAASVAAALGG